MNAEALFRFDYAVRGIDFREGMVGLCREGIVFFQTYFKRRNRKTETRGYENGNRICVGNEKKCVGADEFCVGTDEIFDGKVNFYVGRNKLCVDKDNLFDGANRF